MKNFIIVILMLFFVGTSYANEVKKESLSKVDFPQNVEITRIEKNEFSCTLSFKVYIPTQSGIVGFGMSITADSCEEARAGIGGATKAFLAEMMK